MSFDTFGLIIMPILIFCARFTDVTLMTMRIIFTSQGKDKIAPIIGFIEVFIWLVAMGQIFKNITNIFYYIAYSAGFATGNWTGIHIERKLKIGYYNLQIISEREPSLITSTLKSKGYGITSMIAEGQRKRVNMIFIVIKKKNFDEVTKLVEDNYPNAFVTILNVQSIKGGIFPPLLGRSKVRRIK
ncbi:MAG: DUF2179 domain-containing protein [Candidatus Hodarchaeota archaeon]